MSARNPRRCRDLPHILLSSLFTICLPFLVDCCETLKPDQISWRSESASKLVTCRANALNHAAGIPLGGLPAISESAKPLSNLNVEASVDFQWSDHTVNSEPSERLGLGCRLRGGAKSHRTKCSHQGCKGMYMPLAGDCPYCSNRFCMSHRLPEVLRRFHFFLPGS